MGRAQTAQGLLGRWALLPLCAEGVSFMRTNLYSIAVTLFAAVQSGIEGIAHRVGE